MLTKETTIETISVKPWGGVEVVQRTCIKDAGVQIACTESNRLINPGEDYSSEDARIQAVCHAIHTPEIVSTYQAQLAAANQRV